MAWPYKWTTPQLWMQYFNSLLDIGFISFKKVRSFLYLCRFLHIMCITNSYEEEELRHFEHFIFICCFLQFRWQDDYCLRTFYQSRVHQQCFNKKIVRMLHCAEVILSDIVDSSKNQVSVYVWNDVHCIYEELIYLSMYLVLLPPLSLYVSVFNMLCIYSYHFVVLGELLSFHYDHHYVGCTRTMAVSTKRHMTNEHWMREVSRSALCINMPYITPA